MTQVPTTLTDTEQSLLQPWLIQPLWQWPNETGFGGTPKILAHGGTADAADCRNLAVTQSSIPFESQNFFDFTHG
jgi:hypothetical protein